MACVNWSKSVQNCFGDDPLYHLICPPLVISYVPLLIILCPTLIVPVVSHWWSQMAPLDHSWCPLIIPFVPLLIILCPTLIVPDVPCWSSRSPPLIIPFAPVDNYTHLDHLTCPSSASHVNPPDKIICLFYNFLFFPNFLIHTSLPPFPFWQQNAIIANYPMFLIFCNCMVFLQYVFL